MGILGIVSFKGQESSFDLSSSGKASKRSIALDDPMAREKEGEGIFVAGAADCATRLGIAREGGEFSIALRLAEGNIAHLF